MGLYECKLTCEQDSLFWPKPRELRKIGNGAEVITFDPDKIVLGNGIHFSLVSNGALLRNNLVEQVDWLYKKKPKSIQVSNPSETKVRVNVFMREHSQKAQIRKNTNETYALKIEYDSGSDTVQVEINADNYFGVRHGLESLFQAMEFDDVKNQFIILSGIQIRDYPEFKHRGVSLDTSRNFITVDVIKRIIDGMAHSKLNVFHWHIVDTHSFPVELKGEKVAQMTKYGAYDTESIYTQKEIKDIVVYANYRGVRVIPELDQPAHVGNGWNFPGAEDFTVCLNKEPWYDYCVEPPCGQLNPSKEEIYDILETLYEEFLDMFNFDSFHMG